MASASKFVWALLVSYVALGLSSGSARAGSGKYETCKISNGDVLSCTGWFQGEAAVIKPSSGKYETCKISNGEVFSCTGWFQGEAAVVNPRSGKYETCKISNGDVLSCTGWFQGTTVAKR
jgi:hypothetical protein